MARKRRRHRYAQPSLEERLAWPLEDGFTPDEFEDHFEAWEVARTHWNNGSLEDDPEDHVCAYINTVPRGFGSAVIQTWEAGHEQSFDQFTLLVKLVARYMRDGVPTEEEIAAFHPRHEAAVNGNPHCGCWEACAVCACHCHAPPVCPERIMMRALEEMGYVWPREWTPEPTVPYRLVDGECEVLSVYTGIGDINLLPAGSSTFILLQNHAFSIVKSKHLLVDVKRLALPIMLQLSTSSLSSPSSCAPKDPSHLVARHTGTLVLRVAGERPIVIENVYFCPESPYNFIGNNWRGDQEWGCASTDAHHEHFHVPTGVHLPNNNSSTCTMVFDLPHTGPGFCKPDKVHEEVCALVIEEVGPEEWE